MYVYKMVVKKNRGRRPYHYIKDKSLQEISIIIYKSTKSNTKFKTE